MREFQSSLLSQLEGNLLIRREATALAVPSRLMLNSALLYDMAFANQWFFDQTFPLWATGRVSGLALNDRFSEKLVIRDGFLLGRAPTRQGEYRELQLVCENRQHGSGTDDSTLRNAVIECLASEFCYQMGIPSTRILCVITSGRASMSGETTSPPLTLTRVAKSFLHFEVLTKLDKSSLDYLTDLLPASDDDKLLRKPENLLDKLSQQLCTPSLQQAGRWQAAGLYIDNALPADLFAGGEIVHFESTGFIRNLGSDITLLNGESRPASNFDSQPDRIISYCMILCRHLQTLCNDPDRGKEICNSFSAQFHHFYLAAMCEKLRLPLSNESERLIGELVRLLKLHAAPYFSFFHKLADEEQAMSLHSLFNNDPAFTLWLSDFWRIKSHSSDDENKHINPPCALTEEDIHRVTDGILDGNRNALENCLESIQRSTTFAPFHWAS